MDKISLIMDKYRLDILYLFIISVLYIFLTYVTYAKWGFPVIDSFRNAYVPDQILNGKLLYTDIYFFYGPLIQYLNSLLFKIFGINLSTLYFSGIIVTFITLISLYILSRYILKPLESTVFISFIIVNLVFSSGVHNFIFPYSYEALYACLLSIILLLLLVILIKNQCQNNKTLYIASSILVLLTLIKQDFAISAYIIYFPFLLLAFKQYKLKTSTIIKNISIITLLPCLIYLVISIYTGIMPLIQGLIPGVGSFLFNYELPNQASYYTNTPGLSFFSMDSLVGSIENFVVFMFTFSLLSLALYALIYAITCGKTLYKILACVTILILINEIIKLNIFYLLLVKIVSNPLLFQWLGIFLLVYLIYNLRHIFLTKNQLLSDQLIIPCLTYSALIFLFRSLLSTSSTTTSNYTCIIAFMVLFYVIISQLPNNIRYLSPSILYKAIIISVIFISFMIFQKNQFVFSTINYPISTTRGLIYVHKEYGYVLSQAITFIEDNTKLNDSVMAVPEEMIINFMANRQGVSKYYQLIPCFSTSVVQKQVIQDLKKNSPRYIMVSNSPINKLFNKINWGYDYETDIYNWIRENYVPFKVFRDPSETDKNVDYYKIYTFKKKAALP